jgi:transposase
MAILAEAVVFVGLDYHQESVQVCVLDQAGKVLLNARCPNSRALIEAAVLKRLQGKRTAVHAAIEACCGAANLADELSQRSGWAVSLAHPGFVSRMKQSPDKTDFGDARLLADLRRVGYLPAVWLAPEEIRELRRLVRYRQQLVNERRNAKLRIRALLRDNRVRCCDEINTWTRKWIAWLRNTDALTPQSRWIIEQHLDSLERLKKSIAQAEERLEQRMADDAVVKKLRATPGIGLVTAATMRAEIGRFDRFQSGKQLARFCGLSPRNASSGERQADAGLIKAGNPQLRAVIIEAAHRLTFRDERWGSLCARLLNQGKKRNIVIAAVANRWIRWLYHQMQPERLAA